MNNKSQTKTEGANTRSSPLAGSAPDRRKYWGLYFPGMDEWQAKRSHAEALRDAKAINDYARRSGHDAPAVEVREWPWGREDWLKAVNDLPNVEVKREDNE